MTFVVSVIANPASAAISPSLLARLRSAVKGGAPAELARGAAYDIPAADPREGAEEVLDIGRAEGLDVNILKAANRRKKLLIADMDSTIIQQECIDEIAEYAGKRAEISAITERAMRGELDFEGALKERVAMLKGLPESVLQETFDKRIVLTPGALTLVKTMNRMGAMTALVSGGFTFFTSRVAAETGFQYNQANTLLAADGALTGEVAMPILGRAAKQEALERLAKEKHIDLADTMAVGDGANDLSMLGRSGLGVAFHAKPAVAEAAHARIGHGDLTALLYLQGIPQTDFAD